MSHNRLILARPDRLFRLNEHIQSSPRLLHEPNLPYCRVDIVRRRSVGCQDGSDPRPSTVYQSSKVHSTHVARQLYLREDQRHFSRMVMEIVQGLFAAGGFHYPEVRFLQQRDSQSLSSLSSSTINAVRLHSVSCPILLASLVRSGPREFGTFLLPSK